MTSWSAMRRSLVVGLLASMCVVASGPHASAQPTWRPTVEVAPDMVTLGTTMTSITSPTTPQPWSGTSKMQPTRSRRSTSPPVRSARRASRPASRSPRGTPSTRRSSSTRRERSPSRGARRAQTVQVTRLEPGARSGRPQIVASHRRQELPAPRRRAGTVTVVSRHALPGSCLAWTPPRWPPGGPGPGPCPLPRARSISTCGPPSTRPATVTVVWRLNESTVHAASSDEQGAFSPVPLSSDGDRAGRAA